MSTNDVPLITLRPTYSYVQPRCISLQHSTYSKQIHAYAECKNNIEQGMENELNTAFNVCSK